MSQDPETSKAFADSRYIKFNVNNEEFATPIHVVKEVLAIPQLTQIPKAPAHFRGLMNLRGKVLTVIDLRTKFGIPAPKSRLPEAAVIVLDLGQHSLAICVDSVLGVTTFNASDIQQATEVGIKPTQYVTGVVNNQGSLIVLVDISKLLELKDREIISAA